MRTSTGREIASLTLDFEVLQAKLRLLERNQIPSALEASRLGSAFSIKLRRRYTITRVCSLWGISRTSVFREARGQRRRARRCVLFSDEEIAQKLVEIVRDSPFPAERHRKLWARLRRQGIQVSRERVRRILRDFAVLPPYMGGLVKEAPNQMWAIDSAKLRTAFDGEVKVLFVIEHCNFECLAISVMRHHTDGEGLAAQTAQSKCLTTRRQATANGVISSTNPQHCGHY